MRFEYWIRKDNKWIEVSYEEYDTFDGKKEKLPSTWRLFALQTMLSK